MRTHVGASCFLGSLFGCFIGVFFVKTFRCCAFFRLDRAKAASLSKRLRLLRLFSSTVRQEEDVSDDKERPRVLRSPRIRVVSGVPCGSWTILGGYILLHREDVEMPCSNAVWLSSFTRMPLRPFFPIMMCCSTVLYAMML